MEYQIFPQEMKRRRIAFGSLCAFLFIGVVLAALVFDYHISLTAYLIFLAVLGGFIALFSRYFRYLSQMTITITDETLVRKRGRKTEVYPLSTVTRLRTIIKTDKVRRAVHIYFSPKRHLYINGLGKTDAFFEELRGKLEAKVPIQEAREPLSYDHWLFYPVLGILLGFFSVLILKSIAGLSSSGARYLVHGIAIFIGIMGAYFIIARPTAGASSQRLAIWDYIFGLIMIIAAVLLIFLKT